MDGYCIIYHPTLRSEAFQFAQELRKAVVDMPYCRACCGTRLPTPRIDICLADNCSIKAQLRYAVKQDVWIAIFIMPNEWYTEKVIFRILSGEFWEKWGNWIEACGEKREWVVPKVDVVAELWRQGG